MEIAFLILCSASVKIFILSLKKKKQSKNPNKQADKPHHQQTKPGYLILSLFLGSEGQKQ